MKTPNHLNPVLERDIQNEQVAAERKKKLENLKKGLLNFDASQRAQSRKSTQEIY